MSDLGKNLFDTAVAMNRQAAQSIPITPMSRGEVDALLADHDSTIATQAQGIRLLKLKVAELTARLTPKKQAAHLIITLRDAEYCAGTDGNEFDAKAEAAAKELTDYITSCESSCAELTSNNLTLTNDLENARAWAASLPAELRKI
jgi:hypothetical protein